MSLLDLDASVLVIDREDVNSASRVAAGLITTIAGKGMNLGWRQAEYLPEALDYYHELERVSGVKMFHFMDTLRLFEGVKQQLKFEKKANQLEGWYSEAQRSDFDGWKADHGGFLMKRGGWLDTNVYLQVVRDLLGEQYRVAEFSEQDLQIENGYVSWQNVRAKRVILCQGVHGLMSEEGSESEGLFAYVGHRSSKGEILTVKISGGNEAKIINRNGWMIPIGDGKWRCGANYNWKNLFDNETEAGRKYVESQIQSLTDVPYEIVKHTAGVRPIIRKSQPYIGHHPIHSEVSFFNGLGSKGVTTAPSVAAHFAKHLVHGEVIDPELLLATTLK